MFSQISCVHMENIHAVLYCTGTQTSTLAYAYLCSQQQSEAFDSLVLMNCLLSFAVHGQAED